MRLHDLYEKYHDRVQFLSIYIREAHPIDGWWLGGRLFRPIMRHYSPRVSMDLYDPQIIEERRLAAQQCEDALQYGIRTYVDDMDDRVNIAYAAWPTRLYLVGTDGRVAYAGGMGPYGFKPNDLQTAIDRLLSAWNG